MAGLHSTSPFPAAISDPVLDRMAKTINIADFMRDFIRQSNAIERVDRVTDRELYAYDRLLTVPKQRVDVQFLAALVNVVTGGARLRLCSDQNVRVGTHNPPRGGPKVLAMLERMLEHWHAGTEFVPIHWHNLYLWLHPFEDGNGRSARAMWLRLHWEKDADFILRRLGTHSLLECLYHDSLEYYDMDGLQHMQDLMVREP